MKRLRTVVQQWFRNRRAQKVSPEWARERVRRGAAYLDDVAPGWYRAVDVATLELAGGSSCVLGQLHGDFRVGLVRARLLSVSSAPRASLSPVAFGFQCISGVDEAVQDRDYDYLNRAWRAALRRRQRRDGGSGRDVVRRDVACYVSAPAPKRQAPARRRAEAPVA